VGLIKASEATQVGIMFQNMLSVTTQGMQQQLKVHGMGRGECEEYQGPSCRRFIARRRTSWRL